MRVIRTLRLSTGIVLLLGIALASGGRAAETKSLVAGNTAFALDLYARLGNPPGNVLFSPYSISTALAMTYAGARGNTETQMARVLHFTEGQSQLHSAFSELQRQLDDVEKREGIQLEIANALWAQKGAPILPAFLKIAVNDYQAGINQADFQKNADAAVREINGWVARKTRDRITNIVSTNNVRRETKLVLANALYFKGAWDKPFEKTATSPQPFHISASNQVDALLMHHFNTVSYTENAEFQAVELPYVGAELSMVVVLPRQIDGLGQLEPQLSPAFLTRVFAQMKRQKVEIFLPRFKLESRYKLTDPLMTLGMPDAFIWHTANYSGINGLSQDLYISDVIHKAWIEVAEEGTEAATATAVLLEDGIAPAAPPVFRADHPFIFIIHDQRSGSLLFIGRLANPRAGSDS